MLSIYKYIALDIVKTKKGKCLRNKIKQLFEESTMSTFLFIQIQKREKIAKY